MPPTLLAVCDSCGFIFASPVAISGVLGSEIEGNRVQCPRCSGMGHIPDGFYNTVGDVISVIGSSSQSVAELQRIAEILRRARERKASREEVAETIRKEAPTLAKIAELLPKNRTELYAFLGVVIAILALIEEPTPTNTTITINRAINQVIVEAAREPGAAKNVAPKEKRKPQSVKKEKRRLKKGDRQTRRYGGRS
jgi:ribosome-binding protein aMBF1 (putative translation factor)